MMQGQEGRGRRGRMSVELRKVEGRKGEGEKREVAISAGSFIHSRGEGRQKGGGGQKGRG